MTSGFPRRPIPPSPKAGGSSRSKANLHVARLPKSLVNSELLELFRPWGALTAHVMMDPQTGASRGFGFVTFPSEQAGSFALAAMHNVPLIHGPSSERFKMYIKPSHFATSDPAAPSPYIFVRNIPATVPKEEVLAVLELADGQLLRSQFRPDYRSPGRVIVMIEYDSVLNAQRVIDSIHGNPVSQWGEDCVVMARFADERAIDQWQRRVVGRPASAPVAKISSPTVFFRYDPYLPSGVVMLDTTSSSGHSSE